ncbi:glycosyltransferase [Metallosphaera javensis (ex Sakai et al. 2022)]|uniref:glycosyltransferase n=1 Tax=Metallosphaera javensis (ex Sakai et al. 2022) TaxID=2775498 RepID=UPI00258D6E23|nr:MAG: group 1 glycosyl transferase [Metallosphaera javensis (ex Sakai et al. 2022)]
MVIFIASHLKKYDGQSKAIINFSKGLLELGEDVKIITYYISNDIKEELTKELGINIDYKKIGNENLKDLMTEFLLEKISKYLAKKVAKEDTAIVANDLVVSTIKHVKMNSQIIYWSQGAIASLFIWPPIYSKVKTLGKIGAMIIPYINLKFSKSVKMYPLVLANSKTTGNIISLFYDRSPTDIIYPPINIEKYKPKLKINEKEKYILVFLKRGYPTSVEVIKKLAREIKLIVIGYNIEGAKVYSNVSDEELNDLYSNALALVYPTTFENFGYIPVESMACGTPVIAYRFAGGPSETIINGQTGWLVNDEKELYQKTVEIFKNSYEYSVREKARKQAEMFSIKNMSNRLLNIIRYKNEYFIK